MRTLGIVTARGGSRGIPNKNLADLGGRPLLAWTAESALQSELSRVVLSTDSPEIADTGRTLGLEVPFLRPASLATDSARSIDVVHHALEALGEKPDAVFILQPTTPFRTVDDINGAISVFQSFRCDSVIGVTKVGDHHPGRMKLMRDGWLANPPFAETTEGLPRQQLGNLYLRNGAVYLSSIETIRTSSFQGSASRAWLMPPERSLNIDEPFDLVVARAVLQAYS